MAGYFTVLERKQQSCVVRSWTYDRQAPVSPHERQSAGGDDWYLLYLERTAPGGTAVRFDGDT